nr:MAG TPA: hypothetical protein [Caudoviricetes sp.]
MLWLRRRPFNRFAINSYIYREVTGIYYKSL